MRCQFALLGSARLACGAAELAPPAPKIRTLLVFLLVRLGLDVRMSEIIDELWNHDPPRTAEATVQSYVYRLRKLLAGDPAVALDWTADGYTLHAPPDSVDVHRFVRLERAAARALDDGDGFTAVEVADEALELWRGAPFGGVPQGAFLRAFAVRLEDARVQLAHTAMEARIRLGRHHEVVGELRNFTTENPLQEQLHSLLIQALFRTGRRSQALDVYRRLQRTLAAELGLEPSPALQRLQAAMLVGDEDAFATIGCVSSRTRR